MEIEEPLSIGTLSGIGGQQPVLDRSGRHANGVRRVCFLPDDDQGVRALPLQRRAEMLDLMQSHFVEEQMVAKRRRVSWLLSNDLRGAVLQNGWAIEIRLLTAADKIFSS